MNRKYYFFLVVCGAVFLLSFTGSAQAISVDQDVTLEIGGPGGVTQSVTLRSGSSFTSITVNTGGSVSIQVGAGEQVVLVHPTQPRAFSNNQDVSTTCYSSSSTITLAAGKTYAISVGDTCLSGGGGSVSSGGSSSSGSSSTNTTTTATTTTTDTTTTEETTTDTTTTEGTTTDTTTTEGTATEKETPVTPKYDIPAKELDPGAQNDEVVKLQIILASDPDLYPEGLVTGYYGSLTTAAVKRFQAKYGIAQVGRVGPQTLAKLNEVFGNVMQTPASDNASPKAAFLRELDLGMIGDDVTTLQEFLASDSSLYPEGLVTGYYGSLTTAAVKRFQAKYGIAQVGRVGPQTLAKLNEVSQ